MCVFSWSISTGCCLTHFSEESIQDLGYEEDFTHFSKAVPVLQTHGKIISTCFWSLKSADLILHIPRK